MLPAVMIIFTFLVIKYDVVNDLLMEECSGNITVIQRASGELP